MANLFYGVTRKNPVSAALDQAKKKAKKMSEQSKWGVYAYKWVDKPNPGFLVYHIDHEKVYDDRPHAG